MTEYFILSYLTWPRECVCRVGIGMLINKCQGLANKWLVHLLMESICSVANLPGRQGARIGLEVEFLQEPPEPGCRRTPLAEGPYFPNRRALELIQK